MTKATEASLADFVAQRLDESSSELVGEWIELIRNQIESPAVQTLPRQALRNHIPPVLTSLAEFVRSPTYALRQEMLGHLRLHGQIRRDQGYGLREVLAEFDVLAQHVQSFIDREVLEHGGDWTMEEILTIHTRLATGLRAIVFVASATYRETEQMRAQSLAAHLSKFGRTVAHELRSPLQAIFMAIGALRQDDLVNDPEGWTARLDVIEASVKRSAGLLDDISVLAAVESARGKHRMQDLAEMLAMVRQEMTQLAQRKGVRLEFPDALEAVAVEGVVGQMVLINLISNGIKYSDSDRSDRWVRIRFEIEDTEDAPFVRFEVSDNGLGIAEAFHDNVFQANFRAHPEVAEGSGLGLAISQALVTERGGRIEMESEPGEGSVFRFTLRAIDGQSLSTNYLDSEPEALMRQSVENLLEVEEDGELSGPPD